MASYHGSNTQSEPAKTEQIITEFFAKSLHILLESRCPYVSSRHYSGEQAISFPSPSSSSSSSSSIRPRDKWFNLALRDCPAALENIDFWHQSNVEPMIVDVILVQRPNDWDPVKQSPRRELVRNLSSKEQFPCLWNLEHEEFGCEAKSEKIIERWVVQYESRKGSRDSGVSVNKRSNSNSLNTVYKKSILLLRSLYVTVRLLPAYKLFRDLNSSGQVRTINLAHRVSSFAEPFTRREESEMQRFVFSPVDTSCGRLCISVLYHSSLFDVSSEPSTPMSPQFISDYVGSPMADPLKRFPSIPVPQCYSSSSPFERRHSWSNDQYRPSPPSVYPSPSPTYSDSRTSISKPSSHGLPPMSLPRHLPETARFNEKTTSFDEFWPSPTFSTSPSPSPPTYVRGSHISRDLSRCDSAPVRIPSSKLGDSPLFYHKQILPPSPPLKSTKPSTSKPDISSGLYQTGSTVEKSFGKDETGRLPGLKISSNSSPQKSFSITSSRLSSQDDYDPEFSGPFLVYDDDITDPGSRPDSYDQAGNPCDPLEPPGGCVRVRQSQGAAVGALLHMLKKAPPLCQSTNLSQPANSKPLANPHPHEPNKIPEKLGFRRAVSSGFLASKTTADALEELRGYKEMKNLLLR